VKRRVGVFGATGYTGRELLRLLAAHPEVAAAFATGTGRMEHELGLEQPADAYFLALPHGVAATYAEKLRTRWPEAVVIDLSGDLRLPSAESYRTWYGTEHPAPALLGAAPYGLTELCRQRLRGARLVSNPGCYATSLLLPLTPLLREGVVSSEDIIADSKSGASGAGRSLRESLLFCEVDEDLSAYSPGRQHRHIGEVEAALLDLAGCEVVLTFCPHLLPVKRGIHSALYLRTERTAEAVTAALRDAYRDEPFVKVVDAAPRLADVAFTNQCRMSAHAAGPGRVVVFSAIDNLVKGAAGQAIQNLNVALGWPETAGLPTAVE